jgi:hypothetical protein
MTTLARFSVGRILLHLLAMLGDRCVRFHSAGIMREFAPAAASFGTLRKLAQSLGPYCLAAAILPGGIVLAPLLFLYRRRKLALQAAPIRCPTPFDHA